MDFGTMAKQYTGTDSCPSPSPGDRKTFYRRMRPAAHKSGNRCSACTRAGILRLSQSTFKFVDLGICIDNFSCQETRYTRFNVVDRTNQASYSICTRKSMGFACTPGRKGRSATFSHINMFLGLVVRFLNSHASREDTLGQDTRKYRSQGCSYGNNSAFDLLNHKSRNFDLKARLCRDTLAEQRVKHCKGRSQGLIHSFVYTACISYPQPLPVEK